MVYKAHPTLGILLHHTSEEQLAVKTSQSAHNYFSFAIFLQSKPADGRAFGFLFVDFQDGVAFSGAMPFTIV